LSQCPFCVCEIEEGNRFCPNCGKEQPEKTKPGSCPKCGRGIEKGDVFCTACGTRVVSGKEPGTAAQVPVSSPPTEKPMERARQQQPEQATEAQPAPAVPREACAGAGHRFVALIFDTMIIIFLMNLLVSMGVDLVYSMDIDVVSKLGMDQWLKKLPQEDFSFVEMKYMANLLFLSIVSNFALIFTYFFIMEAAVGATPGKLATGLRVLKKDGGSCTIGAAAVRNLLRFVDALPLLYLLGALFVAFTPYKQRLGDLAAGTVVANKRLLK
jgi:uncharacterized RDD family membrane protein YckC